MENRKTAANKTLPKGGLTSKAQHFFTNLATVQGSTGVLFISRPPAMPCSLSAILWRSRKHQTIVLKSNLQND
ncbi:hypothetical protein [Proteiniphilum sp.]|uniref:hypothetical protein n=1 Tax=Proteiniphilum sp. TaxID=1926877 RepID=UPI002B2087C9|nr:hypothetical protein [Proteiniphilum sp.]